MPWASAHASTLTWRRVAVVGPALSIVAWLLWRAPPQIVASVIVAACALALHELQGLLDAAATKPRWLTLAAGASVTAAFALGEASIVLCVLWLASSLLCLAALREGVPVESAVRSSTQALFGLLYVALPLGFLIFVRLADHGRRDLALIVALTWSRDIGAALIGGALRGRPLWPKANPTKNAWGAAGGAVAVTVTLLAARSADLVGLRNLDVIVLVTLVSVLGQAGDLSESLLKRSAGARHSGTLLAEQGGVLDCVDGLLLVGPAYWCYLQTLPHRSFW